MYLTGDWEGCAREWGDIRRPQFLLEHPCPRWILAARRGDRAEAHRLLARNDSSLSGSGRVAHGWAQVAHARVAAILGDREEAVVYLRRAMPFVGFDLDGISLHTDIDFDSLRDYPPFVELVRPRD